MVLAPFFSSSSARAKTLLPGQPPQLVKPTSSMSLLLLSSAKAPCLLCTV